jgi:hypothetical protein
MEEKNTNAQNNKAKPVGPSKREKMITAIVAIVFVVGVVAVAIIQQKNGSF